MNWAMYTDTYDSYIRTLLNVDSNGLPPGEGNSYDWTPSQLYWVNSAHPIATWPNSGWDIKGILCSQYTDHVAIAGGSNIVEYAPGKAALVIRENVEGSARIAYLGTNFHGEARTDPETRKLVENMIMWSFSV
ncbi:hypothetical protein KEJ18_03720 [Candidatus Bathyarchaeota archaeon]|nr:hypothetical protein [Candidatus Bathyarchaeota archaeon]